ncbi:MAG: DUF2239 family protein [Planctomycetota bacterium]
MHSFTAFRGNHMLASGPLPVLAQALRGGRTMVDELLIFDDRTGYVVHVENETLDKVAAPEPQPSKGRRGRPRLGVIGREVTLLPEHWQWLNEQPGGASAAIRRLVDAARREEQAGDPEEGAQAAYRFLAAFSGELPRFEQAARALIQGESEEFQRRSAHWPGDIRRHAMRLVGWNRRGA